MILAVSTTVTRLAVIVGATAGAAVGVMVAIAKLVPERARIIIGYQGEVLDDLREEMARLKELHVEEVERLERRVAKLEKRVGELES